MNLRFEWESKHAIVLGKETFYNRNTLVLEAS